MTRRKPTDMSFEHWTERQIREAQERGAFDDLPGAGRPIKDLDKPWSAERWAADLARREGVDLSATLPPSLRLRRERERLLAGLGDLDQEARVREAVAGFNDSVREAFRRPVTGPPLTVGLMDVEEVVGRWRELRAVEQQTEQAVPAAGAEAPAPSARGWWARWRRGG